MSNSTLTASIIAREAIRILDNNCVMAKQVFRGYEEEFAGEINGYKKGASVTIRRPDQAAIRIGNVANAQNVDEGSMTITVDKQVGADFKFSSTDLSLNIGQLSERVLKPRMIKIANQIDMDVMALYKNVWNTVGTFGGSQTFLTGFADFYKGPERLNEEACPLDERRGVISPADQAGMLGAQTALFIQGPAKDAYRDASLGQIGQVETFMSQNIPVHTVGTLAGSPVISTGATAPWTSATAYDDVKNSWKQTIAIRGGTSATTLVAGDVFTIDGVFAVNPVTKAKRSTLQQFVVNTTVAMAVSGDTSISVSPPILVAPAPQQTVDSAPVDGSTITKVGTTSIAYNQNLVFHKNAFSLVVVPMEKPPGAVEVARETYNGISVRVIPTYDGINDFSNWRLDCLYGVLAVDPRLATRLGGH